MLTVINITACVILESAERERYILFRKPTTNAAGVRMRLGYNVMVFLIATGGEKCW